MDIESYKLSVKRADTSRKVEFILLLFSFGGERWAGQLFGFVGDSKNGACCKDDDAEI